MSELPTYPSDRFDGLDLLLSTLGSFWPELYGGSDLVFDLQRGNAMQERQLDTVSYELYDTLGRQTCPIYHTDLWHLIDIAETDGKPGDILDFGAGAVYGIQPVTGKVYQFGGAQSVA